MCVRSGSICVLLSEEVCECLWKQWWVVIQSLNKPKVCSQLKQKSYCQSLNDLYLSIYTVFSSVSSSFSLTSSFGPVFVYCLSVFFLTVCAYNLKLTSSSLLCWLRRTDSLVCGGYAVRRATVSFSLPYGYTHCKEAFATVACAHEGTRPSRHGYTLW